MGHAVAAKVHLVILHENVPQCVPQCVVLVSAAGGIRGVERTGHDIVWGTNLRTTSAARCVVLRCCLVGKISFTSPSCQIRNIPSAGPVANVDTTRAVNKTTRLDEMSI